MNNREIYARPMCLDQVTDEELIRKRHIALGAIAEISDNLHDGMNMSAASQQELLESRELFHGELAAYWVELTKRHIA
jgi:hypothetical protein